MKLSFLFLCHGPSPAVHLLVVWMLVDSMRPSKKQSQQANSFAALRGMTVKAKITKPIPVSDERLHGLA